MTSVYHSSNFPTRQNWHNDNNNSTAAKLVSGKIGVLLNRKSKPRWEIRLESEIRKLRQQAKMLWQNMKIYSDETEIVWQLEWKIQLKRLNGERRKTKKILTQDQTIQIKQGYSKTTKENSTSK